MDKLLKILSEIRPDVDFANEKKLIDDGIPVIDVREGQGDL